MLLVRKSAQISALILSTTGFERLHQRLWRFAVAHAAQGRDPVIDNTGI